MVRSEAPEVEADAPVLPPVPLEAAPPPPMPHPRPRPTEVPFARADEELTRWVYSGLCMGGIKVKNILAFFLPNPP